MKYRFESAQNIYTLKVDEEYVAPERFCEMLTTHLYGENMALCAFKVMNCPPGVKFNTREGVAVIRYTQGKKFNDVKLPVPDKPRRKRWVSKSPERDL